MISDIELTMKNILEISKNKLALVEESIKSISFVENVALWSQMNEPTLRF
jgi:hypothetical protein